MKLLSCCWKVDDVNRFATSCSKRRPILEELVASLLISLQDDSDLSYTRNINEFLTSWNNIYLCFAIFSEQLVDNLQQTGRERQTCYKVVLTTLIQTFCN